ncbi:type I restriction-modification enzyme R subunit C-terminal domain-containing protein [Vibrio sp.]|uniref:type I restriction endonuclease subunit R n=1 Tax=Vibrio sp. TaxID=678 RepID=UPI003D120DF8
MQPEERARQTIDALLESAGWIIQDNDEINLGAGLGVAVREYRLKTGSVDYLLFVDRQAVGVIEAKPEGTTLRGVDIQSDKYLVGIPESVPNTEEPPPFAYESTGKKTLFRDKRDPHPRSRVIFAFHRPETLQKWFTQNSTLRERLTQMPPLAKGNLYDCQYEAITSLERSLAEARRKSLVQMATGSGKTYMTVTLAYRLIKHAKAKRILFLVDRNNLGKQAKREFDQYVPPDDVRKFSELYNVQRMTSRTLDPVSKVCITTIQRLYSMLKGEDIDEETEERSLFETDIDVDQEKIVTYNPDIPIETFDFIITDECHRSIYHLWQQVLEYFDAFIIGLTATPSKQTLGFFDQNLVMEYSHERAVADGVNVGYDVYTIQTQISTDGSTVESGYWICKRDKLTRAEKWNMLDKDLDYTATQLDRDVVAPDQIRTIIKTFKEKLFTEIFPHRKDVPKTLVFAKDDSHADDIVKIIREEFGVGNDFCQKITYKTTGQKPEDLISSFRNSPNPRIAVTVDMISTGTDVKPIECILFMRNVKSRVYFEQMKGRGTRTIKANDLQGIVPGATEKTHFVIVDAVGVCENDKTDSRPLERKPSVKFENLLESVAVGARDEDTLSSLANRLTRLDRKLKDDDRSELLETTNGTPLKDIVNDLLDAIDPDKQLEQAQKQFDTGNPTNEQIQQAQQKLADDACAIFDNPQIRHKIQDIYKRNYQVIDTISKDRVIQAGFNAEAKEKARDMIDTFQQFIADNKDELDALQIIYSQPYSQRHLTYEEIRKLADAIEKPPYNLTPERLWQAYEQLEQAKVKGAGPKKLLTDVISLVRFAVGEDETLEPFSYKVDRRFHEWLAQQQRQGVTFTEEQIQWLTMIKEHIATSASISMDDFDLTPFTEHGGAFRVYKLFGDDTEEILNPF